jgi:hypothetical protein
MSEQNTDKNKFFYRFDKIFDPSVPTALESKGPEGKWINYGIDNLYPQFVTELYAKSAINRTALLSKKIAVAGNGLVPEDPNEKDLLEYANPEQSWQELWSNIVLDYEIYNGFCLNVVWSNDGTQVAAIYHVDFNKVRSGNLDKDSDRVEYYWVSTDWSRFKKPEYKPRAYHRYDPNAAKEFPSQLLYFFEHEPAQVHYPLPSYSGAMTDICTDIEVSSYHLSHLKQGLTPSMIINLNQGDPGDIQREAIYQNIADGFSGTQNAGKFFLSFNQSKDTETTIQTIQPVGDDYYIQLEQRITTRILSGHRITSPKITGIYELAGGGGIKNSTKDELLIEYELFKQQVVIPDTRTLLKPVNRLWKLMGGKSTLTVEPINLFPGIADPTTAPDIIENAPVEQEVVTPV